MEFHCHAFSWFSINYVRVGNIQLGKERSSDVKREKIKWDKISLRLVPSEYEALG